MGGVGERDARQSWAGPAVQRWLLALAMLLSLACVGCGKESVHYQPIQPDAQGNYPTPQTSDVRSSKSEKDAKGVVSYVTADGKRYYHPFNVATQAMSDNGIEGTPELDMDKLTAGKTQLTPSELDAFRWLFDNGRKISNGGLVWVYTFPLYYTNFTVLPPWPSAFAQARVMQAGVYAYRITRDRKYLDLALRAARAYALDVSEGGLQSKLDGLPFFEEVPLPDGYSPHILNGHLYSVAMLYELAAASGDDTLRKLADAGADTIHQLRGEFDSGYWTKYDLVPRLNKLLVCVNAKGPGLAIGDSYLVAKDGSRFKLQNTAVDRLSYIFVVNLPEKSPIRSVLHHPGYTLQIAHKGDIANVGVYGIRENEKEYYELPPAGDAAGNGAAVAEYRVPFQLLANWNLSRTYQRWHARLARKIGEQRKDPEFLALGERWQSYIAGFDKETKEKSDAPCPLHPLPQGLP